MTQEFPAVLFKHRDEIEAAMRKVVGQRASPLYRMMEYHLGWIDEGGMPSLSSEAKRVRPTLCLLACESLGGDPRLALPAAAAVELIHNFSLIHDDIQDGALERHHRATVWWVWGPAQAINAGDGMHALARLALLGLGEKGTPPVKLTQALEALDSASLELCEGQYEDISYQERVDITVDAYLRMARLKAGGLIGCAMELGALVATDGDAVIAAFAECGRKLGTAFQIHDDVLDLWSVAAGPQATPPGDILSKKKTLPVVYAFEKADVHQKRELGTLYLKRVLDPADVPRVLAILEEVGAREYAQKMVEELWNEALGELERVSLRGNNIGELKELAEFYIFQSQ